MMDSIPVAHFFSCKETQIQHSFAKSMIQHRLKSAIRLLRTSLFLRTQKALSIWKACLNPTHYFNILATLESRVGLLSLSLTNARKRGLLDALVLLRRFSA